MRSPTLSTFPMFLSAHVQYEVNVPVKGAPTISHRLTFRTSSSLDPVSQENVAGPRKQREQVHEMGPELLSIEEVPLHLRFNRYVLHAYRPLLSIGQCLLSLFYIHNETCNIYSHLIPSVVIWCFLPEVTFWRLTKVTALQKAVHGLASSAAWAGSAAYHLFMAHDSGPDVYRRLLNFDVLCVWLCAVAGTTNAIYVGLYCYRPEVFRVVIAAYTFVNAMFLWRATKAKTPWGRASSFLFLMACRWTLYYVRTFHYGGGSHDTSKYMLQHDLLTFAGVIISVLKVPERLWPGAFDLLLNSHNFLHVLSVIGALPMHRAIAGDFQWLEEVPDEVKCSTIG